MFDSVVSIREFEHVNEEHGKEIQKLDLERKIYKEYLLSEMVSIFFFQMVLCVGVFTTRDQIVSELPPSLPIAYTRMMAGLFMQIKMS